MNIVRNLFKGGTTDDDAHDSAPAETTPCPVDSHDDNRDDWEIHDAWPWGPGHYDDTLPRGQRDVDMLDGDSGTGPNDVVDDQIGTEDTESTVDSVSGHDVTEDLDYYRNGTTNLDDTADEIVRIMVEHGLMVDSERDDDGHYHMDAVRMGNETGYPVVIMEIYPDIAGAVYMRDAHDKEPETTAFDPTHINEITSILDTWM